jgi:hypothetical protein
MAFSHVIATVITNIMAVWQTMRGKHIKLKELGFHLSAEEFLAIRFHMGVHSKKTHFLYDNAVRSQLRYITTKADRHSASKKKGWG